MHGIYAAVSRLSRVAHPVGIAHAIFGVMHSKCSLITRWTLALCLSSAALCAEEPLAPKGNDFEANLHRVFADDGSADIRVIFGYDNYEELKDPCDPARSKHLMQYLAAKGFVAVTPTPELAEELGVPVGAKNLRICEGLGSQGQRLRVSIIWSSATSSTAKNIGSGHLQQLACSKEALKFMQKAASEAEVMIYVGHSREGGGPDTFPPETLDAMNLKSQVVNFAYYRRERPGLNSLAPSFQKSANTPLFIAWASCSSQRHFKAWFSGLLGAKNHPTCLVLSNRLIRYKFWLSEIDDNDEGLMVAVNMIEAFMWGPSQEAFKQRLLKCEMGEVRDPNRDAWTLSTIPGRRSSTRTDTVTANN